MHAPLCRWLFALGWGVILALNAAVATAGQNCEARRPTVESLARDLELAASVAEQLDAMAEREGTRVALIARAGQNLSEYGLRWSHLGFAYRDAEALEGRGAWRVVHKLNHCGSDRSAIYRQGLAEFFGDGLYLHEAGVQPFSPALQAKLLPLLKDDRRLAMLHEPRYNMLAYPWSGPYQQSNQWALETLAMLVEPNIRTRQQARAWLRALDYRPQTIYVSALKRLGARVATAHISFDDHPFDQRLAGRIETVTVESIFAWLPRAGLGSAAITLRPQPLGGTRKPGNGRPLHTEVDLRQRAGSAVEVHGQAVAKRIGNPRRPLQADEKLEERMSAQRAEIGSDRGLVRSFFKHSRVA